jgi:hypothetical protein
MVYIWSRGEESPKQQKSANISFLLFLTLETVKETVP